MEDRSFWLDRPTFVTGASGQLGSWLVARLLDMRAEVVCLVRDWVPHSELVRQGHLERVKVVRGDLREPGLLERSLGEYEIDTVIHLAAQSIVGVASKGPASTFDTNIRGTWLLLEACRQNPTVKQVVLASTDKVYGEVDELPYTEEMSYLARYPHDVSKACADMIAQCYAATYDLRLGMLRLPNLFGGGDLNWNRIVPGTIRSILRGQPPVVHSDGQFVRDFLYVEDAAAAHLLLAECLSGDAGLSGQAFNISNEFKLTVLQLVRRILDLMDSDLQPLVQDQAKKEIRSQYLSATLARAILGWQPLFTLDEGLQRTIDWYRAYFAESTEKLD